MGHRKPVFGAQRPAFGGKLRNQAVVGDEAIVRRPYLAAGVFLDVATGPDPSLAETG